MGAVGVGCGSVGGNEGEFGTSAIRGYSKFARPAVFLAPSSEDPPSRRRPANSTAGWLDGGELGCLWEKRGDAAEAAV